jgi:inosine-uridine nucleoside N-ribohydrolase
MAERPEVILDCDPGQDDAVALVLAGRHAELLAVTTVSGNVPLESTTRNALVMTQLLGLDVAVHAGADRPLLAQRRHAGEVHGETGLDGAQLPALTREAASAHAVEALIAGVRSHPGCWLVVTGPMTNVALALRQAPDLTSLLGGISFMGGSATIGNVTSSAEFNIWCDPEAAMIVLDSGVRLRMAGLHVTHEVRATRGRIEAIRDVGTESARVVADLLSFYGGRYAERLQDDAGAPLHDPVAVVAVTHPQLLELVTYPVTISRAGPTRGMTIVDRRPGATDGALVEVAMSADSDAIFVLLAETLATYP